MRINSYLCAEEVKQVVDGGAYDEEVDGVARAALVHEVLAERHREQRAADQTACKRPDHHDRSTCRGPPLGPQVRSIGVSGKRC